MGSDFDDFRAEIFRSSVSIVISYRNGGHFRSSVSIAISWYRNGGHFRSEHTATEKNCTTRYQGAFMTLSQKAKQLHQRHGTQYKHTKHKLRTQRHTRVYEGMTLDYAWCGQYCCKYAWQFCGSRHDRVLMYNIVVCHSFCS